MVRGFAALIVLTMMAVSAAQAQQVDPVDFSIKGGVNFSNLAIDPDVGQGDELFLRFGGGGSLGMNFSRNFSITADVLYLMKGNKVVYTSGNELDKTEFEAHTELDYVVINPNLRIGAGNKSASPYLLIGPEIGILVKAESHMESNGEESYKEDVKDSFKNTDFGLSFGGGIELPTKGAAFFVEGRYSLGLADIADAGDTSTEDTATVQTRGIYAFAGIRF